jgi:NAD(P)-dependent dehydrogenase (short-subunit alcohol dehydrogenase family)
MPVDRAARAAIISAMSELNGKIALVTGAGGGMGHFVALELARRGAHVIVHARNAPRAQPTVDAIARAGGSAEVMACDLAALEELRTAARAVREKHKALHVLVNNAGYWSGPRSTTPRGIEMTWAVNVLAPFVLVRDLMEPLRAGRARVVNVSSREHYGGRMNWDDLQWQRGFAPRRVYQQSKLALVMQTNELARREPRLSANSLHPGVIATDLFRNMPWIVRVCIGAFCPSPEQGARTIWNLAVDDLFAQATGKFYRRFKQAKPHPLAKDESACARLWAVLAQQAA